MAPRGGEFGWEGRAGLVGGLKIRAHEKDDAATVFEAHLEIPGDPQRLSRTVVVREGRIVRTTTVPATSGGVRVAPDNDDAFPLFFPLSALSLGQERKACFGETFTRLHGFLNDLNDFHEFLCNHVEWM